MQLPMAVIVTCAEEFTSPPVFQLSFAVAGAPITITLYLPVVLTKFVEPLQLSRDDFFHRWKQIQVRLERFFTIAFPHWTCAYF